MKIDVEMLSKRMTKSYLGEPDFLASNLIKTSQDAYDPHSNPNGFVNLGTAVNALNEAEIEAWLLKDTVFQHRPEWQHYHQLRFRNILLLIHSILISFLKVVMIMSRKPLQDF